MACLFCMVKAGRPRPKRAKRSDTSHGPHEHPCSATLFDMWHKPSGVSVSRDAVRLAPRVDVATPGGTDAGSDTCSQSSDLPLFTAARRISSLFGGAEVDKVLAAIVSACEDNDADAGPDQGAVAASFFESMDGDSSPTVRVLKCLHQKYVLEAVCALKLQGPLQNIITKDDRSSEGWRVIVRKGGGGGRAGSGADGPHREDASVGGDEDRVCVIHRRREHVLVAGLMADAMLSWELTMEFDAAMTRMVRCSLTVTGLQVPERAELSVDPEVNSLKERLMTENGITVFTSEPSTGGSRDTGW